jgi:formamidopyrimidine-DNA glycosylase
MPELPEVHTTATELNSLIKNKKIVDIWTSYKSSYYQNQIKDPAYFKKFKSQIKNCKVVSVERRAKNILINLDNNKTILVHLKMTGHLLYGKFKKEKGEWIPNQKGPLNDKMNGWIRLVFTLSNGKHLALSDLRKFAKVTLETDLDHLGPEPLERAFTFDVFKKQINKKPTGKIKTVLMNQELISGIGNIYSDEALWMSKIDPETPVKKLISQPNSRQADDKLKLLLKNIKEVLRKGIKLSGDSMSDYRRPDGSPGEFQKHHRVYQRKNLDCFRKDCKGKIERKVVNGRSCHFCPKCQKS